MAGSDSDTHSDEKRPVITPVPGDPKLVAEFEALADRLESLSDEMELLAALPEALRTRLRMAAGNLSAPTAKARSRFNKARRRMDKRQRRERDAKVLEQTGIQLKRKDAVFVTPNLLAPHELHDVERELAEQTEPEDSEARRVIKPVHCYVCKTKYEVLHFFYDQMCPACAEFNWAKRHQTADLTGRVALLTGGRVKIGYHVGIKLLRAGAKLIVTTRFPRDAARRFAAEDDFGEWGDRLEIFGLDLRHTPSVEVFCAHLLGHLDRLDFIVNNACQTVRRPPGFYRHMLEDEQTPLNNVPDAERPLLASYHDLRAQTAERPAALEAPQANTAQHLAGAVVPSQTRAPGIARASELSTVPMLAGDEDESEQLFPTGALDQDQQQIDLRERNSWRLTLSEVSTVELLEVQLVNAVAPYVLNARLKPLMAGVTTRDMHVVNVSAVEGQFYRRFKTDKHPHTNMAKAALNMMTRTSATTYVKAGIHMNAVDTGWVSDEDVAEIAARKRKEQGFTPPLDIVDGAARILDPIFDGLNTGEHVWGQFLKDYKPADW
jgi:NAD(P)-dependent dehydrogenase (short-subunit alcohol dehydrogenase family)